MLRNEIVRLRYCAGAEMRLLSAFSPPFFSLHVASLRLDYVILRRHRWRAFIVPCVSLGIEVLRFRRQEC